MAMGWDAILAETPAIGPIRAYSELMPPPYVGRKPSGEIDRSPIAGPHSWRITEWEEQLELRPGLQRVASTIIAELRKLASHDATRLSRTLLAGNPAWPPGTLAERPAALRADRTVIVLPLALSRTQDDKGRVRWTLFGNSHLDPARAFWRSFFDAPGVESEDAEARFEHLARWAGAGEGARVLGGEALPAFARRRLWREDQRVPEALITFRPFASLPSRVQEAYLEGALALIPCPHSLIFFGHQGYAKLGASGLPHAAQAALLHLFPRSESSYGIRIPQSGWLDESPEGAGHRVAGRVKRTHRWQRVERDDDDAEAERFDDAMTIALFSSAPDDLGLYGKPMARNAQIWSEHYEPVLHGPTATREALARAEAAVRGAKRSGYRFYYPPMMAGTRSVFWHRPLIARPGADGAELFEGGIDGVFTAEGGAGTIDLWPRVESRDVERSACELFGRRSGLRVAGNVRKLLEWRELLGAPLPPSFARRLVTAPKDIGIEAWLKNLIAAASEPMRAVALAGALRSRIGDDPDPGESRTYALTQTREFEERYWRTIAHLTEGEWRECNNADGILANAGKTGGRLAAARAPGAVRHLDALGDWLHGYYAELIEQHGMTGRAFSADHDFVWRTDFDLSWSDAWRKNQTGEKHERNIVVVIPGKDRTSAVIMGDHYDTAYMEDVYEPARGGDHLRAAAAGADDNHSATAALMLAADVLLPLSAEGALARDVWLVHLSGEEFPADCLGARALVERLLRGDLSVVTPGGARADLSGVQVAGAFILDMIAHNHDGDRDVFQISPGEGPGAARLAYATYLANLRWNREARVRNRSRAGLGRSRRMPDGSTPPPLAEHARLFGQVRPEHDPRSSLYNTDGQIFSDAGLPVVLLMENYDIRRAGYHDTQDTMANIDLDYGAALAAIAIEAVVSAASE